ncbi:MAG: winged helix-turn-helix domain-containing protein [Dehalococcoidales bacterium]|nr:winged helix-turn-helix domain-containing protein [Dehalococcoidales bacterium]
MVRQIRQGEKRIVCPITGGQLVINLITHRVTIKKTVIELPDIEFRLLCVLARTPGQVIPHEKLLVRVWGEEYCWAINYVHVHMKRLRDMLNTGIGSGCYISNIRGKGYRLD